MSASKNHTWPAYVDMMTVLLMVYILLSMIFQIIAALAPPPDSVPMPAPVSETSAVEASDVVIDQGLQTYSPQGGDFVVHLQPGENFVRGAAAEQVRDWLRKNRVRVKARGMIVFALSSQQNVPLGVRIRLQYDRAIGAVKLAEDEGISSNVVERHSVDSSDVMGDVLILRVK